MKTLFDADQPFIVICNEHYYVYKAFICAVDADRASDEVKALVGNPDLFIVSMKWSELYERTKNAMD